MDVTRKPPHCPLPIQQRYLQCRKTHRSMKSGLPAECGHHLLRRTPQTELSHKELTSDKWNTSQLAVHFPMGIFEEKENHQLLGAETSTQALPLLAGAPHPTHRTQVPLPS